MYYLNVWLTVKDEKDTASICDALRRTGAKSREEEGCERWEAYQTDSEPTRFLLVERWTTKEHWEAHRQGAAVTEIYLREVIPLVDREPYPSQWIG
jgi:quinol monooxygenase YgiN